MRFFNIEITYMDDRFETIEFANETYNVDGVLSVYQRKQYGAESDHLGSFPLVNIRKWKRIDR